MSLSLYDVSVPPIIRMLSNLSKILDKAVTQANEKNIPLSELLEARLTKGMHPLARQIQIATETAKNCAARLADTDPPVFPETDTSFPQLQARIAVTINFLRSVKPEKFAGAEDRTIVLDTKKRQTKLSGVDFLNNLALPNFHFHMAIAYAILRQKGIVLRKRDYLTGGVAPAKDAQAQ